MTSKGCFILKDRRSSDCAPPSCLSRTTSKDSGCSAGSSPAGTPPSSRTASVTENEGYYASAGSPSFDNQSKTASCLRAGRASLKPVSEEQSYYRRPVVLEDSDDFSDKLYGPGEWVYTEIGMPERKIDCFKNIQGNYELLPEGMRPE